MRVCLAGTASFEDIVKAHKMSSMLESFYYFKAWQKDYIKCVDFFLLDSGAFTFIQSKGVDVDWGEYVERYANFINENDIDKFFELDIDSLVGYEEVINLRNKLEKLTGKKVIPVWHKGRGYEEYKRLCEEYPYIGIGGVAIKEIKPSKYDVFKKMINDAHERGCKVHGLGCTGQTVIERYHFDSVDSTGWTGAGRWGTVFKFDGKRMWTFRPPSGSRVKLKVALENNLMEWIKF